jgi:hypothetical protein
MNSLIDRKTNMLLSEDGANAVDAEILRTITEENDPYKEEKAKFKERLNSIQSIKQGLSSINHPEFFSKILDEIFNKDDEKPYFLVGGNMENIADGVVNDAMLASQIAEFALLWGSRKATLRTSGTLWLNISYPSKLDSASESNDGSTTMKSIRISENVASYLQDHGVDVDNSTWDAV